MREWSLVATICWVCFVREISLVLAFRKMNAFLEIYGTHRVVNLWKKGGSSWLWFDGLSPRLIRFLCTFHRRSECDSRRGMRWTLSQSRADEVAEKQTPSVSGGHFYVWCGVVSVRSSVDVKLPRHCILFVPTGPRSSPQTTTRPPSILRAFSAGSARTRASWHFLVKCGPVRSSFTMWRCWTRMCQPCCSAGRRPWPRFEYDMTCRKYFPTPYNRSKRSSVVKNTESLVDWLIDWLIDWFIDWCVDWSIVYLIDWLFSLIDCFHWLIDWLIVFRWSLGPLSTSFSIHVFSTETIHKCGQYRWMVGAAYRRPRNLPATGETPYRLVTRPPGNLPEQTLRPDRSRQANPASEQSGYSEASRGALQVPHDRVKEPTNAFFHRLLLFLVCFSLWIVFLRRSRPRDWNFDLIRGVFPLSLLVL